MHFSKSYCETANIGKWLWITLFCQQWESNFNLTPIFDIKDLYYNTLLRKCTWIGKSWILSLNCSHRNVKCVRTMAGDAWKTHPISFSIFQKFESKGGCHMTNWTKHKHVWTLPLQGAQQDRLVDHERHGVAQAAPQKHGAAQAAPWEGGFRAPEVLQRNPGSLQQTKMTGHPFCMVGRLSHKVRWKYQRVVSTLEAKHKVKSKQFNDKKKIELQSRE